MLNNLDLSVLFNATPVNPLGVAQFYAEREENLKKFKEVVMGKFESLNRFKK